MLLSVRYYKWVPSASQKYPWRTPSIWMFTHFCDTDHAVLRLEAQRRIFSSESVLYYVMTHLLSYSCCCGVLFHRIAVIQEQDECQISRRIRAITAENQPQRHLCFFCYLRIAANLWSKAAAALLYDSNIASIITICPHCYSENKELYVIQRNQRL